MVSWSPTVIFLLAWVITWVHLSGTVSAQELDLARLQRLSDEHKQQIARQIQDLSDREALVRQIREQHEKLKQEVAEVKGWGEGLRQEVQAQRRQLDAEREDAAKTRAEVARLSAELKAAEDRLAAATAQVTDLRLQLQQCKALGVARARQQQQQERQQQQKQQEEAEQEDEEQEGVAEVVVEEEEGAGAAPEPTDVLPAAAAADVNPADAGGSQRQREEEQVAEKREQQEASEPTPAAEGGSQQQQEEEEEDPTPEASARLARYNMDASPERRRDAVREEFLHAWRAYEKYAWGSDEVKPVTKQPHENFGMGLTLVDSLDTMYIMDLREDFDKATQWVEKHLNFGDQEDINLFETTIRILGGLLSSYALSSNKVFLDKAEQLADKMLFAFDSPTGLPFGTLGLKTGRKYNPAWSNGASTLAEVGTLQMEWQYLSRMTRKPIYEEKVDQVTDRLALLKTPLYTQFISPETGQLFSNVITFGARVDSVYEYFLKQHLLSGGNKPQALQMYLESMAAMIDSLVLKSTPSELVYVSEKHGERNVGKMDHLVCFVPGMLALGAHSKAIPEELREEHMQLAKDIMATCYEFYRRSPTGLAPEIVQFGAGSDPDFTVDPGAPHSLLRPETVESLFVLWRTTKDQKYRDWGWEIFQSFVRYTSLPEMGYSGLKDVRRKDIKLPNWSNWNNKHESFFLAETLKYLYLLFSEDDVIPLDKYVFNTEAHPLPIASPSPPSS